MSAPYDQQISFLAAKVSAWPAHTPLVCRTLTPSSFKLKYWKLGCAWGPLRLTIGRKKEHSLSLKQGKIFPYKAIAGQCSRPRDNSYMTEWGKAVHMRLPFPTRWQPYIDYTRSLSEIGQNFLNFYILFLNFP